MPVNPGAFQLTVLSPACVASGGVYCETVTIHPNGKSVYVCNRESGNIRVYSRNPATGLLTTLQTLATGATEPYGLAFLPKGTAKEGKYAYLASQGTTAIYWYEVKTNGELTKKGEVACGEENHCVTISADGKYMYAPSYKNKAVYQYKIEASGEPKALSTSKIESAGLQHMHIVVISPSGTFAYGGCGLTEGTVAILERSASTGLLTFKENVTVGAGPGFTESVCLSPDGSSLYAIQEGKGEGSKGSIAVFAVNVATGGLTFVEKIEPGIECKSAVVSPDGLNLYCPEQGGKKILQFTRDTETGELAALTPAFVEPGEGSSASSWLAVSANGKYLYAAMRGSEQVAQLKRAPNVYS